MVPLRITPSAISAFRRCAYSYAIRYVVPLPEVERLRVPVLALGSAVHAAIARFLRSGGWERRGLDELMAMLGPVWDPSGFPEDDEELAFEQARALLVMFYEHPYPANVARELGIERNLSWRKARRGVVAAGKVDRVCMLDDQTLLIVDYKTGRLPEKPERLHRDVQTLIYRSLGSDCYRWLSPSKILVAFRFIGAAETVEVELAVDDYLDGWEDLLATADAIRAARHAQATGAYLLDAFPPSRGPSCRGCEFAEHCNSLDEASNIS
jgi:hypothetical protein